MEIMEVDEVRVGVAVRMNVPDFFEDEAFLKWLNNSATAKFTWHRPGSRAGEYSDVIVLVDPTLDGSGSDDLDMPTLAWDTIIETLRELKASGRLPPSDTRISVHLTNIAAI